MKIKHLAIITLLLTSFYVTAQNEAKMLRFPTIHGTIWLCLPILGLICTSRLQLVYLFFVTLRHYA